MLVAASGDQLELGQGPNELEEVDGWVVGTVETPIIGGTGRFVGASGTLNEAVPLRPFPRPCVGPPGLRSVKDGRGLPMRRYRTVCRPGV